MTQKSKTALFAGSFNPFTVGHRSIVERTLTIADRVIVAVGFNAAKPEGAAGAEARAEAIDIIFADEPRVETAVYSGLTVDFAREAGADFLVRGVRSAADFEYERNLADINREIAGIETVLLCSLPEYGFVSSSMVRELQANGFDAGKFLPKTE